MYVSAKNDRSPILNMPEYPRALVGPQAVEATGRRHAWAFESGQARKEPTATRGAAGAQAAQRSVSVGVSAAWTSQPDGREAWSVTVAMRCPPGMTAQIGPMSGVEAVGVAPVVTPQQQPQPRLLHEKQSFLSERGRGHSHTNR